MNRTSTWGWILLLWGVLQAAQVAQAAEVRGTVTKVAYMSGGVGRFEAEALPERGLYSFWMTTMAKESGAFVAGVRVRILNVRTRQSMLEHTMEGPRLFVALPKGRYQIEACLDETVAGPAQTIKRMATIRHGKRQKMILYFDTSDSQDQAGSPFVAALHGPVLR